MGSKCTLLMKFGQFMSYYKRKNFIKRFYKDCGLKTSSRPFLCLQRIKHNFYWKMKFLKQATYIGYVIAKLSQSVQISKLTDLLRIVFTEDSLKIKKSMELVSRSHFSQNFSIKKFIL